MKTKNIFISILAFILLTSFISAYLNVSLADHGSNIRNKGSGELLASADLRIEIYNAASGGNLIYNETFTGAIINGSWNIMLGENSSNPLPLDFGKIYYKDYLINGENINFTNLTGDNVDRQFFYSPLGDIAGEDINNSANIIAESFNATRDIWAYRNLNLTSGYLYATNGTLISWINVLNGTLALNSTLSNFLSSAQILGFNYYNSTNFNINNYLLAGNWNSTNTSYYLATNPFAFYNSTTFPQNASLMTYANWNATNTSYASWANVINGTMLSYAQALNGTLATWAQVMNGTVSGGGISWATANNGTLLNYSSALNNTLMQQANWNATNTSYYLAINPSNYINWATANNGTLLNYSSALNGTLMLQSSWNATNTSYRTLDNLTFAGDSNFNGGWQSGGVTISNGDLYAQKVYVYNITSLNVSQQNLSIINDFRAYGNAQIDGSVTAVNLAVASCDLKAYSNNGTLYCGSDAVGESGSGISWAEAINGTLLKYSDALNNTLMQQANWNATNTSYYLATNPFAFYNSTNPSPETRWNANYSDFLVGYNYAVNSTGGTDTDSFVANYSNFTRIYANVTDYNSSWSSITNTTYHTAYLYATNGTYLTSYTETDPYWNANASNFTTLYVNQIGNASSNGITWATANNGTLLNYSSALNNTLMQQANWNSTNVSYMTFAQTWANVTNGTMLSYAQALNNTLMQQANWNATNTSYYLATNPFGFYNSTNPPPADAETQWNANYSAYLTKPTWSQVINGTAISMTTGAYALNSSLWTLNYSTFLTHINWATANNGTLLNYSSALNGTLMLQSSWNATNTSYASWANVINGTMLSYAQALNNTLMQQANWNATNTSYMLGANYSAFLTHINWATANNGTLLNYSSALNNTLMQQANWNATNASYRAIINHTFYNGTNIFFGINTSTPQNQLNVGGDANVTLDIFARRTMNLTSGYLYATNGTYLTSYTETDPYWNANASNFTTLYANQLGNASSSGITWTNVINGTMLSYAQALNNTLMQQANWNATNTSYMTFAQTWANMTNGTMATWAQVMNGTVGGGGITWATANNGTLLNYSSALNNTLMQQANWNATNTSYYLATNPFAFYNSTNPPPADAETQWNANYSTYLTKPTWAQVVNGTAISMTTGAYALNSSLWTLNYSAFLTHINWATANNGTLLNYSSALNGSLILGTNLTYAYSLGWQNNASNFTVVYGYATNATGGGISWATANNGTLLNYSSALNNSLRSGTNNSYLVNMTSANGVYFLGNLTCNSITGGADSDFCTDATGGASGLTEWINVSNNKSFLNSTTSSSSKLMPNLNTTLLANTNYTFDCKIVFMSNVSTTGIALAMDFVSTPTNVFYTAEIPVAADATGGAFQGWGTADADFVVGTGVQTALNNYTAHIYGMVNIGGANNYVAPAFRTETATNVGTVTVWMKSLSHCRWTLLPG